MTISGRCDLLAALCLTLMGGCAGETPRSEIAPPPPTRVETVVETIHGVEISDPYRWLEDQESPETRAWLDAQNAYTLSLLGDDPRRPAIERRLADLLRVDQEAVPLQRGKRFFIWKKRSGDDLWILYVRDGIDGADRALLDPHSLSEDHTTSVGLEDVSADGTRLVYSIRRGGADETELRIMDVDAHEDLADRFPTALYRGVTLRPDKAGFYYSDQDRKTGIRIRYHAIGSDPAGDGIVFGEGYGPGEWIGADISESGRYLLFQVSHGWGRTELHLQDLESGWPAKPIVDDVDASFYGQFSGDRLFVRTNWKAPNGRIVEVNPVRPDRTAWKEVVAEGEDAIQDFSLAGGHIFVRTLHDVISRIRVYGLDGTPRGEVEMPGIGTAGTPSGIRASSSAFFAFQSFTTPPSIYRYDLDSGTAELWSRIEVPFDTGAYVTEQVWFPSKDGTKVPMFLVHAKDIERDGERPVLLYGYGGFNVSLTPRFSAFDAVWLESGGVYAQANLRGGGEFGDPWHKAGMLGNKQNVFDDFTAAAEWLIANGWTSPEKLAIQGGSNGGLLVGAVLTQHPGLYRAVLCEFPDLDMVRYWQFENNNPPALLEYGDARDPRQFKFLYAYSPYQKVRDGVAYPAVMLTSGDRDTRVPPLQARKMTARLQAASSSGYPVVLLYDTKAGHAGGRPQSKIVDDLSLEATFLFSQLGVKVPDRSAKGSVDR